MIEKLKAKIVEISEPRRTEKGNLCHKLEDIMIIGLCTVISNGGDYEDMEIFGQENEEWLREKLGLELPNGIPNKITFERVYEALKPEEVSKYMLRSKNGIENLINIISICYVCSKLLPLADSAFAPLATSSPQTAKYAIGDLIRRDLFFADFVAKHQNDFISLQLLDCLANSDPLMFSS